MNDFMNALDYVYQNFNVNQEETIVLVIVFLVSIALFKHFFIAIEKENKSKYENTEYALEIYNDIILYINQYKKMN